MKTTEKTKTQTEETLDTSSIEFDQMVQKLKKQYGTIYQIEIADQRVIFKPLSGGIAVPIIIRDVNLFMNKVQSIKNTSEFYIEDAPLNKLKNIVFPYSFDVEKVKSTLNEFSIIINEDDLWAKICGQNIQDVLSLFNKYKNPMNKYMINSIG